MAVELKVPLSGIIIFSSSSISTTIEHRASSSDYRLSIIVHRLSTSYRDIHRRGVDGGVDGSWMVHGYVPRKGMREITLSLASSHYKPYHKQPVIPWLPSLPRARQ